MMTPAFLLPAAAIAVAAVVFILAVLRRRHRRRLLARELSPGLRRLLEENFPLYKNIPGKLRTKLQGMINLFMAEKHFEGCGGQVVDDGVKVMIAATGCILAMNRVGRLYPELRTILVYPDKYISPDLSVDGGGEGHEIRIGESWMHGPVVLAWCRLAEDCRGHGNGNVGFHEFAHRLDREDAITASIPESAGTPVRGVLRQTLQREYLLFRGENRHDPVLSNYAAKNPAEFFAVATEAFFVNSATMRRCHFRLYQELRRYYRLNPAVWRHK